MAFVLGKSSISTITGKVKIYEPRDNDAKKHVATLAVTTKVFPRTEFVEMCDKSNNDAELCKEMITDIKSLDGLADVPEYKPDLIDDMFEYEWQFTPVLEFVMRSNSESMGRAIARKN